MKKHLLGLSCLCLLAATPIAAGTVQIWVVNTAGASISVIDAATNKVVRTIEGFENPHGVEFSLDGTRAYVGDEFERAVTVIAIGAGRYVVSENLGLRASHSVCLEFRARPGRPPG